MDKQIKVSKQTLIKKVYEGIENNGWSLINNCQFDGTMASLIEPMVKYLEKKGIEVK
jgi:hypothetical protein